jgi:hypothetical protein
MVFDTGAPALLFPARLLLAGSIGCVSLAQTSRELRRRRAMSRLDKIEGVVCASLANDERRSTAYVVDMH